MSWKWLMLGGKEVLWAHQCSLEAEWMCWNVRGQNSMVGRTDDKATQQSPSQLLSGKTWRSKHRSPSLLDLASTFTGTGGRKKGLLQNFAGLGDGEACVSHTREPPQPNSLAGGKWKDGKERDCISWSWLSTTLCSSFGRNEPRL